MTKFNDEMKEALDSWFARRAIMRKSDYEMIKGTVWSALMAGEAVRSSKARKNKQK